MAVDLKVPEMGESVTEVYIGQWQKKEGEHVEQDDALVEIESDKATLDLRAPSAGVLKKILKQSGESAEVGEVIGQLGDATEDTKAKKKPSAKKNGKEKQPQAEAKQQKTAPASQNETATQSAATDPVAAPRREAEAEHTAPLTPSQRRLAREQQASQAPAEVEPPPAKSKPSSPDAERDEDRVAMSPIRRRIALRLVEAQTSAALLTTFNEVDMAAVKQLRAEHGKAFEERHGVRLGFMPFFVKAAVNALQQCPELNAMIDGDDIVYRRYYDIGVAISTDRGLVVPILRDADRLSFAEIEHAIEDFAKRARSGDLKVDELQGGTFTITNGGVFGSLLSTPIVNPPQSGVLGMHTIQNRPVAVDDQVVIRPMMYLALTYDHRIVDGREAVTFLRRIKEAIEEPALMLIEA